MTKGLVICYINRDEFNTDYEEELVALFAEANSELVSMESDYPIVFVPTEDEATRIEKVDFDKPFPYYIRKVNEEENSKLKKPKKAQKEEILV